MDIPKHNVVMHDPMQINTIHSDSSCF